jgi:hypothetical protein
VDDLRVIDILIFKGRAEYKRKKKLENYCYKIKKKDLLFFINKKKNKKPEKKATTQMEYHNQFHFESSRKMKSNLDENKAKKNYK